jgi:hypothetical protein
MLLWTTWTSQESRTTRVNLPVCLAGLVGSGIVTHISSVTGMPKSQGNIGLTYQVCLFGLVGSGIVTHMNSITGMPKGQGNIGLPSLPCWVSYRYPHQQRSRYTKKSQGNIGLTYQVCLAGLVRFGIVTHISRVTGMPKSQRNIGLPSLPFWVSWVWYSNPHDQHYR